MISVSFRIVAHLHNALYVWIVGCFLQRGEHLQKVDEVVLPSGKKKEKLIETYEGLPVIGEGVVVDVDEDGEISGMTT